MAAYVELPLVYDVTCKAFRSRQQSRIEMLESITLPVRETSSDEAPVAVKIRDSDNGAEEELRWFEGRYWIADAGKGEFSGGLRQKLQLGGTFGIHVLDTESLFLVQNFRKYVTEFRAGVRRTVDSERCRDVTESNRDLYVDRIAKRVDRDLMMIDGVLHMAVREPFLILYMEHSRCVASVSMGMPTMEVHRFFAFSLDRSDDFRAVMDSAVAADELTVKMLVEAEFLCGETTLLMREKSDLLTIANERLEKDERYVTRWSKEKAAAWFCLRDALAGPADQKDDAAVDAIADAFTDFGELMDIGAFGRAAIERWRLREIDVEEATAAASYVG